MWSRDLFKINDMIISNLHLQFYPIPDFRNLEFKSFGHLHRYFFPTCKHTGVDPGGFFHLKLFHQKMKFQNGQNFSQIHIEFTQLCWLKTKNHFLLTFSKQRGFFLFEITLFSNCISVSFKRVKRFSCFVLFFFAWLKMFWFRPT